MKIIKSYKFRLKPDCNTNAMLQQHGGNSRFLWNKLVEFSQYFTNENKKFPNQSILQKEIINIKNANAFLRHSHSQPLQIHAQRLTIVNSNSIKPKTIQERKAKVAKANTPKQKAKAFDFGKPKFKAKHFENDSIFYPQNFKIKNSKIFLAKIGWIPFVKHRKIQGKPLHLTIKQDGEQWHCSIACEIHIKDALKPDVKDANIIGIDVGVKVFATCSDGTVIKNPRTLQKRLRKLKKQQKVLSRRTFVEKEVHGTRTVSSNNRTKQKRKVRKTHRKIKQIRNDFLHKVSHHMITKYDGFILETLSIKSMLASGDKNLNRNILDVSWFEFGRQLEYKSLWNSKYFVRTDRYSPTTKKCSQCGNIVEMELKDRAYDCPLCDNRMDRDYNASLNILSEGLDKLNNTTGTVGINACGQSAIAGWTKQEKFVENFVPAFA